MLELARDPEEHLAKDLLLARELVVKSAARDTRRLGQLVHRHGAHSALQEEPLGGADDCFARPRAAGIRGFVPAICHLQITNCTIQCSILYCLQGCRSSGSLRARAPAPQAPRVASM